MAGYVALVHKDKGTSYGVSFPDVPGCISAGDTLDEALSNAAEALAGHLALMRKDGDPVPVPRSPTEVQRDAILADDLADATIRIVSPVRNFEQASNAILRNRTASGGARTMAKSTRNTGKGWTPAEVKQVRQLAKENTPTRVIGLKLGRTENAVRSKATEEGISLKPPNQSPYNRRKP
jgi:predicted RNase H-like HicB family nuclease